MKVKPKQEEEILLFVVIMILSCENMLTTNNKMSYFGFDFNRKSTNILNYDKILQFKNCWKYQQTAQHYTNTTKKRAIFCLPSLQACI